MEIERVPFVDLKKQCENIGPEIEQAIRDVLGRSVFSGGYYVEQFEKEFASFCNVPYAVGVGSGTEALWLALKALGIEEGDEVITVPNTFIATAEAISLCGATLVFVDVDEKTYTMDPTLLEAAITARTKAIIPVHLFGQMADMDRILDVGRANGLFVIEDACQAHGAEYKGKKAGVSSDAGCFSFYPSKNLGAFGEAGAIVTRSAELNARMRMIRDHGQERKYFHKLIGWNARMDGLQGAILSVKLKHLPVWNESRRRHALVYNHLLGKLKGVVTPYEAEYARHVYHIYAIRLKDRNKLMTFLSESRIDCGIHYPIPIHLQEAYRSLRLTEGSFPVAEESSKELLSLPMYPEITTQQVQFVAQCVARFMEGYRNDHP